MTPRQSYELAATLANLLRGSLTPSEAAGISARIAAEPDVYDFYLRMVTLEVGLEWTSPEILQKQFVFSELLASDFSVAQNVQPPLAPPVVLSEPVRLVGQRVRTGWVSSLVASAAVALLFYSAFALISWNLRSGSLPSGTDGNGTVAVVQSASDLVSENGAIAPGTAIQRGQAQSIAAGIVELKLSQGATLLIEGPAEWIIDGDNSATLKRGKLVAEVPAKAVGFAVETPTARVVDLGTEFGVELDEQGATQVHVYRGAVSTSSTTSVGVKPITRLVAGQSIKVDVDGKSAPAIFVGREQIFKPSVVGSDPRKLLAFYPFDGDARDAGGNGFDATKVEQVEFVEGHERMAARFSGELTSFVELPIDASADTVPDFTWGAWVRPAKPIERASEILSTDDMDYDRVLTVDGRVGLGGTSEYRFAAFGGPAVGAIVVDRPRPKAGQWTFLAAVYRQATGTVALYVENPELRKGRGGLVSEIAGNAKIGPSYRFVRVGARVPTQLGHPGSFCGEIDNVFLFADALGHKELEAIRTGGATSILALATGNSERNTTNNVDQTPP